ncbi:MAG: serine/threonine protein kinase, partial [Actinobacteria bacterium]|nr:serine/threonine protein kinase [Actinomycetota bacterium]
MPEVLRKLGRYEIVREVGRGGMAVVYLARQTDLDRVVALKELAAFHAADPAFAERFVRESRIAGSLSHPNIVTVHDFLEHEGTPYIAMEYVEGGSLRPLVGQLTLAQIAGVLECVLAGLAHAEDRGIVHRDLKPENVMVTADGAVKIADFGIAKALNQAATAHLSATGTAMGTPAYMAPEQALAKGVGPWTDLYSTGVIAYELLVGRLPFDDRDTPMAVLLRHIQDPIPPPRSVNPDLDERLAAWLERMLEKDPERRPSGAAEAWEELEEIVLGILGPRWRRQARLVERPSGNGAAARTPTTPAPVQRPSPEDIATKLEPTPVTTPAVKPPRALRRARRRVVLGVLGVLGATAGIVLAVVLVGSEEPGASPTQPTRPTTTAPATTTAERETTPAAARPVVEDVAIRKQGETVKATIRTSGPKLDGSRL